MISVVEVLDLKLLLLLSLLDILILALEGKVQPARVVRSARCELRQWPINHQPVNSQVNKGVRLHSVFVPRYSEIYIEPKCAPSLTDSISRTYRTYIQYMQRP